MFTLGCQMSLRRFLNMTQVGEELICSNEVLIASVV